MKITAKELKAKLDDYLATHTKDEIEKDIADTEKRAKNAPPEWEEMLEQKIFGKVSHR